jgi:hypothetical protein
MAVTKIYEPYVRVKEVIRDYPTLLNIDGTCNIGGVIVAPTGPRLAFVNGPQDFLDKYTIDGRVPRNADITFLNAYYLSFSAGLVLARSMNTTAVDGLFFTVENLTLYKMFIEIDEETLWTVKVGEKYYFYNDKSKKPKDFYTRMKNKDQDDKAVEWIANNDEETFLAKDAAIFVDSLQALAVAINEADETAEASYDAFAGAIVSKKDLYSANMNSYGLTIENGKAGGYSNGVVLKAEHLLYKDNVALTNQYDITFADDAVNTDGSFKKSFIFTFGQSAYYHGAVDRSAYQEYSILKVDTVAEVLASINGYAGIAAGYESKDNYKKINIFCSDGNEIYAEDGKDPDGVAYNVITTSDDWVEIHTDYNTNKKLFEVYPDDPQEGNNFRLAVGPDEGTLFYLTLKNEKDEQDTYEASLLSDGLDSAGVNAYIENLNTLRIGYTFLVNQDFKYQDFEVGEASIEQIEIKINQAWSFGDSGLSLESSKDMACRVNGLYVLEDQELYDIEYLSSFGIVDLQFIKNYTLVGKNNYWFTPVDIPWNRTNKNSIKQYFLNVDNTSNVLAIGPFDKNTGLTGWMFKLAPTSLYYTKVMNNRAANSEYAPVFDITNGILDYTNPYYLLGADEREALLNFKCPVNFVKYNQRADVYYFNDNRTHQTAANPAGEEQNRRLINRINKDLKRILEPFKGRLNTVTTRMDVETVIDRYFQQYILPQNYTVDAYDRKCNEENNTPDIITANKLKVWVGVRLNNAIKYIDVLDEVFAIGMEFDSNLAQSAY